MYLSSSPALDWKKQIYLLAVKASIEPRPCEPRFEIHNGLGLSVEVYNSLYSFGMTSSVGIGPETITLLGIGTILLFNSMLTMS